LVPSRNTREAAAASTAAGSSSHSLPNQNMAFQALNKLSPFSSLPPAPSLPSSTSATSNLSQQLLQRPLEVQQTSSKFTFPTQSAPAPAPPPAAASHPSNINNASTFSSSTATSNDMSFDQPEMKRENSAVQRARGHHVRNRLSISTATAALSMTDSESQQPSSPTKDDTATNSTAVSRAKKKKGQKFYCEGYGDCSLSFTRSEHLLRHIRYSRKVYDEQSWKFLLTFQIK